MAYSAPLVPSLRAPLSSETIREQFGLIASAFGQMPATLGIGSQGFTGGQWNSATLIDPTISLGRIGSTTQPCTVVSGYIAFHPSSYTALGSGNVGLVRNSNGRLNLYHDSTIKSFWDNSHNFVMGSGGSEMATTSSGGFLYLPTVNGVATGAPTAYTGGVAAVVDRAAKKIGLYIGGLLGMDSGTVVVISSEKVTAMLEHLYNVPLPYRYSVPVIRVLEEAMEGAKTPRLQGSMNNGDH